MNSHWKPVRIFRSTPQPFEVNLRGTKTALQKFLFSVFCLALLNLSGFTALAQTTTATIRGTVYDQAGAVVSGAKVTATNAMTGLIRSATTEENGTYLLTRLPVGTYSLSFERQGFSKLNLSGITLQIEQIAQIDSTLTAGGVSDTTEIKAEAPIVNTTTPEVGEVIDNNRIVELPLNGRQFLQLAQLSPGITVSPNGGYGQKLAGFNGPRITSNGARESDNYFTLDGINATDPFYNTLTISPSVDAIQEFKVAQNLYSAEHGKLGGAQINIITKSGTNNIHGTAYEFLRNDVFDARNFFDGDKPPFRQNQYGVSLGGPIIKNRTFFFGNFEGLRIHKAITQTGSVPTAAERRGDLRAFPTPVFDPLTGQPFPNNIIPTNRIDPAAKEILNYIPLPNASDPIANLISSPTRTNETDQFMVRLDHQLSAKDSIYVRYAFADVDILDPFGGFATFAGGGNGAVPGFGVFVTGKSRNLVTNWTRIFTSTLIGEFKFGFNHIDGGSIHQNSGNDFGQRNNIAGTSLTGEFSGFPLFRTQIFTDIGDIGQPIRRKEDTFQYSGDMSWSLGKHSLKFGAIGEWLKFDPSTDSFARGQFNFFGTWTANPYADFLLGLAGFSISGQGSPTLHMRSGSAGTYVQDSWQVTPKFTLNLGLRWEYFGLPGDKDRRQANYLRDTNEFVLASKDGQVNTELLYPGALANLKLLRSVVTSEEAGLPAALIKRDLNNFAPRIGFAWNVFGQKTVVRAGYGVFFNEATLNQVSITALFTPPFFNVALIPSLALPLPLASIHTTFLLPPASFPFFFPVNPDLRTPYIQQWNLSIQQELTKDFVLEARYVGSKGTKLSSFDYTFNLARPGDPATAQARLPYPDFAPSTGEVTTEADSSYNALQLRATQRLWHGLTYTANYTFAKSIDDDSGVLSFESGGLRQDPYDRRADRGLSNFDVRHNFVANFTYDLPFTSKGRLKQLAEGWQLTGIVFVQSGRPGHVNYSGDRAGTGDTMNQRPDVLRDPNLSGSQRTPDHWFDTDAFALQAPGKLGNSGRSIITADGYRDVDFSIIKLTSLSERFKLQFRAEFFNIFNFANFDYPNLNFVPAGGLTGATGAKNVNPSFGKVFSAKDPRIIQFGLKLLF